MERRGQSLREISVGFFYFMTEYYKNLDLADIKYFCEEDLVWKIEEWEDIGPEGFYQISTLGRPKSVQRINHYNRNVKAKILRVNLSMDGYPCVSVRSGNKSYTYKIHRLVAVAFIPNPDNKPQVNNVNGNKLDCSIGNLEWNTAQENMIHAYNNGLQVGKKGEKHGRSKLTEEQVLEIRAIGCNLTQKEIAEIYNISISMVHFVKSRTNWAHI